MQATKRLPTFSCLFRPVLRATCIYICIHIYLDIFYVFGAFFGASKKSPIQRLKHCFQLACCLLRVSCRCCRFSSCFFFLFLFFFVICCMFFWIRLFVSPTTGGALNIILKWLGLTLLVFCGSPGGVNGITSLLKTENPIRRTRCAAVLSQLLM